MRQIIGFCLGLSCFVTACFSLGALYYSYSPNLLGFPFNPPLMLLGLLFGFMSWVLYLGSKQLLKTVNSRSKAYQPRFAEHQFQDEDAVELNETEFKFLEKQLWGSLSPQLQIWLPASPSSW